MLNGSSLERGRAASTQLMLTKHDADRLKCYIAMRRLGTHPICMCVCVTHPPALFHTVLVDAPPRRFRESGGALLRLQRHVA